MVTKCLPFRSDKYAKKTYWKIGCGEKEMGSFIGCVGQVKKTMSSNHDDDNAQSGFQNIQKYLTGFICSSSHFITLRSIASAVICSDGKLVVSERFQPGHSVSLCVYPRYVGDRCITWNSTTASLGRNTAPLTPKVDLGLKKPPLTRQRFIGR